MTPEERWMKIENQTAENQKQIAEINRLIFRIGEQIERKTAQIDAHAGQIDAQIEKNTAAIRDLIIVSRSVIEAQQATEKQMVRDHSEVKAELELLIKALNTFLKQGPNGHR